MRLLEMLMEKHNTAEAHPDFEEIFKRHRSQKFHSLRREQTDILRQYAANFLGASDVAIELPTGAGKTLIALLLAKYWLDRERSVAVLCANKILARQFEAEAKELQLPAVLFEGRGADFDPKDLRKYHRARAIGIMNYWVYFNVKPAVDPADLLVLDDAHVAEQPLSGLFSCNISASEHRDLYESILNEIHSSYPYYRTVEEILEGDEARFGAPEMISFADLYHLSKRLTDIIDASPHTQRGKDLYFDWNNVRESLPSTCMFVTRFNILIRPYMFATQHIPGFSKSEQRIYLSATIGDPDDLARRIGIPGISKITASETAPRSKLGRRLSLRLHEYSAQPLWNFISTLLRESPKSLWLCSSFERAKHWRDTFETLAAQAGTSIGETWILEPTGTQYEDFINSPHGHLFTAGRYDGMDFPDDVCRIAIMPDFPIAINALEEFFSAYLADASFLRTRMVQRFLQALGRCNRNVDDYSVYLLLDERFGDFFSKDENLYGLPRDAIAEIDLANDLSTEPLELVLGEANRFIRGEFSEFDIKYAGYLESAALKGRPFSDIRSVEHEAAGWHSLWVHDYAGATEHFKKCFDLYENSKEHAQKAFWAYCLAWAKYLEGCQGNASAFEKVPGILEEAIRSGARSSWFNRLRNSLNAMIGERDEVRAEATSESLHERIFDAWDSLLERVGTKGAALDHFKREFFQNLESKDHDKVTNAIQILGELIGYSASRPKRKGATDCRWRYSGKSRHVFTIEVKAEKKNAQVSLHDVNQAQGQHRSALNEFSGRNYAVFSLIVTDQEAIDKDAQEAIGSTTILKISTCCKLAGKILALLREYRSHWDPYLSHAKDRARNLLVSRLPEENWLTSLMHSGQTFLKEEDVLAAFGRG